MTDRAHADAVDRESGEDPFSSVGPEDLRRAVRAVAEEWDASSGNGDTPSMRSELSRVCSLIEESHDNGRPPEVTGGGTALSLRLLRRLRSRIIRSGGSESERLDLLRAFEDTRDALEAEWSRRFGLGMAGPCGAEVAAEIAHGLRSSCSSILFAAEVLREGMFGELNEKQQSQVELLYRVATALSTDLSDLTELAWRMRDPSNEGGRGRSIDQIVDHLRDALVPVATWAEIDLAFDVSGGARRPRWPTAFQKALHNLVLFALRRAPGGRVAVEIQHREGDGLGMEITTGGATEESEGWDPSDPYAILLPGPEDDDLSFSSQGLRLHAARELVRAMGGELELRPGPPLSLVLSFDSVLEPSPA